MTNHADTEQSSYSIADLAADAADVRRVLDLGDRTVQLPRQARVILLDAVIPDRALALVAGLVGYGD